MVIDPKFVQTAVEIVLRAGEIQMSRLGQDLRVDKKGPIDLVTAKGMVSMERNPVCPKSQILLSFLQLQFHANYLSLNKVSTKHNLFK